MKKFLPIVAICLLSFNANALDTTEYDICYKKATDDDGIALCMKAQTQRVLKELQNVYTNLSKIPDIEKWNNGNGLMKGNLKDTYNHWLNYRNRFCSLYKLASQNTFGSQNFHYERCLLSLTQTHYDEMHSAIVNANSGGEEDD